MFGIVKPTSFKLVWTTLFARLRKARQAEPRWSLSGYFVVSPSAPEPPQPQVHALYLRCLAVPS